MEKIKIEISGKDSQTIIEFLILNIPIFERFKDSELKIIEKYMNLIEINQGDTLFKEGDLGDFVCFIVDGSLDVLKKSEDGEEFILSTLSKGESLGEMAIVDELPRSATVRASSKSILFTLSKESFSYILDKHSDLGVKILKGIARLLSLHLRETSTTLVDHLLPVV